MTTEGAVTTTRMLETHPDAGSLDPAAFGRTVDALLACAAACSTCADACLAEDSVADLRTCIRTDLDCADVCVATARVLARAGSGAAVLALLAACVEACRACAVECERHAEHHEHCRVCAQACRACADACEELLTALGGAQP